MAETKNIWEKVSSIKTKYQLIFGIAGALTIGTNLWYQYETCKRDVPATIEDLNCARFSKACLETEMSHLDYPENLSSSDYFYKKNEKLLKEYEEYVSSRISDFPEKRKKLQNLIDGYDSEISKLKKEPAYLDFNSAEDRFDTQGLLGSLGLGILAFIGYGVFSGIAVNSARRASREYEEYEINSEETKKRLRKESDLRNKHNL